MRNALYSIIQKQKNCLVGNWDCELGILGCLDSKFKMLKNIYVGMYKLSLYIMISDSLLHHTGGPCLYIIDFISKVDNESCMSSKKLIGYPPRALKSSMYQRNRQDLDKSSKIFPKKCTLLFSFSLCKIVTLLHIF